MSGQGLQPHGGAPDEPAWLTRLSAFLAAAPPEPVALPLPDAMKEIEGWLRHKRREPWFRVHNRLGLDAELALSVAVLGGNTQAALEGALAGYVGALAQATSEPRPTPSQRHAALAAGDVLRSALATPAAVRAIWHDVVDSVESDVPQHLAVDRLHLLVSQLEASGHDAKLLQRLSFLLDDDAVAYAEARWSLGLAPQPDDWSSLLRRTAGAAPTERLALCEDLLTIPPVTGRCIAWLAYKDAQVTTELPAGPCHFLNAHWAIGNAAEGGRHDFLGRHELQDELARPPELAPDEQVVLARVDLGWRTPAGAMQAAVDLVSALTDTAYLRSGGSRWLPYGWEMLLVDGRRVWSRVFVTDDVTAQWPRPYVLERTSAELAAIGNRLGAVLAASPLPPDLFEAVRSATEAESADLRSRIVLYDRVTELVAANAAAESGDELRRLLTASWPTAAWRADVLAAVEAALQTGRLGAGSECAAEVGRQIKTSTADGGYTLDFVATAERVQDLTALVERVAEAGRAAETFGTFHEATAYISYIARRREECTTLAHRLRRVRNALAHGNPVQVKTIRTVSALAEYIGSAALSEALSAFMDGHDIFSRLGQHERDRVADLETIRAGTTPADLLRQRGMS